MTRTLATRTRAAPRGDIAAAAGPLAMVLRHPGKPPPGAALPAQA